MSVSEITGLAYPRKLVEQTILGLQSPLNRHLIKLVAFDFSPEIREHFRREVKNWLNEIKALRLKPNNRRGAIKFYYDLLFDYPFGGVELENMRSLMELIEDQYGEIPATKTPEETVEWLRRFHTGLAERLHKGEDVLDLIPQ